jgi:hypothetical protein
MASASGTAPVAIALRGQPLPLTYRAIFTNAVVESEASSTRWRRTRLQGFLACLTR